MARRISAWSSQASSRDSAPSPSRSASGIAPGTAPRRSAACRGRHSAAPRAVAVRAPPSASAIHTTSPSECARPSRVRAGAPSTAATRASSACGLASAGRRRRAQRRHPHEQPRVGRARAPRSPRAPTHRTPPRARASSRRPTSRTIGHQKNIAAPATCERAAERVAAANVRELVEQRRAQQRRIGEQRGRHDDDRRRCRRRAGPSRRSPTTSRGARHAHVRGELADEQRRIVGGRGAPARVARPRARCAEERAPEHDGRAGRPRGAEHEPAERGCEGAGGRGRVTRRRHGARRAAAVVPRYAIEIRRATTAAPGPTASRTSTSTTSQTAACHAGRSRPARVSASATSASTVPCAAIMPSVSTALQRPPRLLLLRVGASPIFLDRPQLGARQRLVLDEAQHQRVGLAVEHLAHEVAQPLAQHALAAVRGLVHERLARLVDERPPASRRAGRAASSPSCTRPRGRAPRAPRAPRRPRPRSSSHSAFMTRSSAGVRSGERASLRHA